MFASRASRRARSWVLSIALLGCSNDLDAFFTHDAAVAPTGLTPYQSALRVYGDDAACLACVEDECKAQAETCAADEDCAWQAACRAECDGPACIYWECKEPYPYREQPTAPLEQCLLAQCKDACRVGQKFDCAGSYADFAPNGSDEITVTWQITDYLGQARGAGWRARGCRSEDPECMDFVSTTTSDAQGIVEVAFPLTPNFSGSYGPPQAYAELVEPGKEPPDASPTLVYMGDRELPRSLPRSNRQPIPTLGLFAEDWNLVPTLFGREQDPTLGAIGAVVWDCRMSTIAPATGVTVEIDEPHASTWAGYGAGGTEATDGTGAGQVYNVPPGPVRFSARFEGEVVASTTVLARPHSITTVWLLPPPR